MQKIEFSEFSNILDNLSISLEEIEQKQKMQKLEEKWENIVGPIFKNHSAPYSLINRKLTILVDHSSYKQEFSFIKNSILRQIRVHLNFDIRFLEIRIGRLSFKKPKTPNQPKEEVKGSLVGKDNLVEIAKKETDINFQKKLIELIKFL